MSAGGDLFLGLDVGTQGTKGLVVERGVGVVARATAGYDLLPGLPVGAAEQHPATWIDAVAAVAAALDRQVDLGRVRGVGVSGQQHGFVALDADLQVIRPAKLWCDTSTSAEAAELGAAFGHPVPTGFTASKIAWLKRYEPESWQRLRHVLLPHDYVNLRLTGELSMEPGDASGTGLFDVVARRFAADRMAVIDPALPEMFPGLRQPGECAGRVDPEGARLLRVPEGTKVSTGGGDNMMSAIGSGAVREGIVVLSLGTSGTVFTHLDRPPYPGDGQDPDGLIAPFCGSAGGWLPLLCVMNLTGVTEAVVAASGRDHEQLTRLAAEVPAGCDGLLWLPFLAGERVPDLPSATGTLLGMRAGSLRSEVLYRAAMEGTSLNLAWGMQRLVAAGVPVGELRLVGGAARNPLWRRILADVTGVPVRRLEEPESAALGAALQAMWVVVAGGAAGAIEGLVAEHVRAGGEVDAPGPDSERYAAMRDRFAAALRDLHRV